jgi:antitoxin component YwqK of YwqJK toxin-antitoxin module
VVENIIEAMKKTIIFFVSVLILSSSSIAQSSLDTIYYDRNWKGVHNKAFATFYRVIDTSNNDGYKKLFRDYYISGIVQGEGEYESIDRYDDANSVFAGECVTYYKSEQMESKRFFVNGKEEGEHIEYYENGLIKLYVKAHNGKFEGILTQFNEDGTTATQIELENGEPKYDWYTISNKDGCVSKLRLSDNSPIWESPELSEQKVQYTNGLTMPYYIKNGIFVGMTNTKVKDYGKWYQIGLIIENNSMFSIVFDPDSISSTLVDDWGDTIELEVWSAERYLKKIKRSQNWAIALTALAGGLSAATAGYSTSTSTTYSNTYGFSTSTTTTYNPAAAYQTHLLTSNTIMDWSMAFDQERQVKDQGYLKKTTIYPGESISGYINIEREWGNSMVVILNILGMKYVFPWTVSE